MEVYAGYSENADHHVGRLLDAIEEMGELDNTLVIWIWGDNGASLEGTPTGTFNEGTMVNGLPLTDEEQMQLTLKWGGLEAWGTEMMYPHYSTAWAWAGNTPVPVGQAGRLAPRWHAQPAGRPLARADQRRRRAAVAVHARDRHRPDDPRHRRDPPAHPRRRRRAAADDRRHASPTSLADANAPERHTQQYFENFGNRAMYKDGWWLAMRMPRVPWRLDPEMLKKFAPGVWNPDDDPVELYYLPDDFSQANDLAAKQSGEGAGAAGPVLGGGREVQHQAAARRVLALLRHPAAARRADDHHLLRRRAERRPRTACRGSTTTRTRSAPTSTSPTAAPRA